MKLNHSRISFIAYEKGKAVPGTRRTGSCSRDVDRSCYTPEIEFTVDNDWISQLSKPEGTLAKDEDEEENIRGFLVTVLVEPCTSELD